MTILILVDGFEVVLLEKELRIFLRSGAKVDLVRVPM